MTLTLATQQMNIALLNIVFGVVGIALATVPVLIGMKHQNATRLDVAVEPLNFDELRDEMNQETAPELVNA